MKFSVNTRNINEKQDNLLRFSFGIATQVLQKIIGIILDTDMTDENGRSGEGTIITLARLDPFIVTCLACLQLDGLDSVGGHR